MKAAVVFGPPGTGKSTYLSKEIAGRVEEHGIENVSKTTAVLSFTRAAAGEIAAKIDPKISASTMHSLCYGLCGIVKEQVISWAHMTEFADIVGVNFTNRSPEDNEEETPGDTALALEALARARMLPLSEVYQHSSDLIELGLLKHVVSTYRKWKRVRGYVDFTDMLELALNNPAPSFKTLIVDEAQDLSALQYAVLDHWAMNGVKELILAGDDDQAIYVWGGADPKGMFSFAGRYNAVQMVLDQSYRLPHAVHDFAQRVSDSIHERVDKKFLPRSAKGFVGELSTSALLSCVKHGVSSLVLYRCHSMRHELEKILVMNSIPYLTLSGMPGVLQGRHRKAIDSYRTLQRVLKGEGQLEFTKADERFLRKSLMPVVQHDLTRIRDLPWQEALVMSAYHRIYLERIERKYGLDVEPTIKLSTIHGAKGREADVVVLYNSISNRIRNSLMVDGQDAEKRVFYVGVTRAKDKLHIINGPMPFMWQGGAMTW